VFCRHSLAKVMAATKPKSPPRPRRITGKEDDLLADEARQILRAEMVRRGYSFKMLAEALAEQQGSGPIESVQSLTNKVNRGRFSFAFFLRAARAMGVPSVEVHVGMSSSRGTPD
jgi:uncharacterized Zn finger protein